MNSSKNLKHRCLLTTLYVCGLRIHELLNLRVEDIDSAKKCINIRNKKGVRDRIVPLPKELLGLLRSYYRAYKPRYFLFEGRSRIQDFRVPPKYSSASLYRVLRQAVIKSGITKKVTPTSLGLSYARHLYESGLRLQNIQQILGYSNVGTFEAFQNHSNNQIANSLSLLSI